MKETESSHRKLECSKCGAEFTCKPAGECWCSNCHIPKDQLEILKANYKDCLCEDCVKELSSKTT